MEMSHWENSSIPIMKANEKHYFSNLFGKALYMFQTCPLSIIRSISTLPTLIFIIYWQKVMMSNYSLHPESAHSLSVGNKTQKLDTSGGRKFMP
jgi:hypothetical protein